MGKNNKRTYEIASDFDLKKKMRDLVLALNTPEKVDSFRCMVSPDAEVRNAFKERTNGDVVVAGLLVDTINTIRDKVEKLTDLRLEISDEVRENLDGLAALLGDRESALIANATIVNYTSGSGCDVHLSPNDLLKQCIAMEFCRLGNSIERMVRDGSDRQRAD